jgi:predicted phage tail protein
MKITLNVTKPLRKFIPTKSLILDVHDFSDIVSALKNQFPKFENFLNELKQSKIKHQEVVLVQGDRVIDAKRSKLKLTSDNPISVVPVLYGHSNTYGFTDLYNDVQSSFLFPLFGLITAGQEQMEFEGLDRRVRDSSLFRRASEIYDVGLRTQNDIFGSLKINTTANSPVPLNYGMIRVSGTLINAYVKNYRADPDEFKVHDIVFGGASENIENYFYVAEDYVENDYVQDF